MAMVVYTNVYSTIAQNKLTSANNNLGKSIERLSSGLRINHAADDASGLAISEKLRGQIRGMARANMNAQDAISFLQTAEGGMEVIGDMLQRMRELAVQAGNGTYTSNDRAELQKEVDQLKSEINRIAASTEFNTKKLLTGDSAALWSTSNPDVLQAIVRGKPAEGNYKLSIEATEGLNYIYKTDIMTVGAPQTTIETYEYTFTNFNRASGQSFSNISGEITKKAELNISTYPAGQAISAGINTYGVYKGKTQTGADSTLNISFSAATHASSAYVVIEAVKDGDFAEGVTQDYFRISLFDAETGERTVIPTSSAAIAGNTFTIAGAGTFTFNSVGKFAEGDKYVFSSTVASTGNNMVYQVGNNGPQLGHNAVNDSNVQYAVLEMDDTGNISLGTGTFRVDGASATLNESHSVIITPQLTTKTLLTVRDRYSIGTGVVKNESQLIGGNYPGGIDVTISQSAGSTAASSITGKYLQDLNIRVSASGTSGTGSYIIEYLGANTSYTAALTTNDFKVTFIDAETGLEHNVAITAYAATAANGTLTLAGGVSLVYSGAGGQITTGDKVLVKSIDTVAGSAGGVSVAMDGLEVVVPRAQLDNFSLHNVQMDANGNIITSRLKLSLENNTSGVLHFGMQTSNIAELDTKLHDISLFTNADGRMVLENTQELTIFGNGKQVTIYLEGADTVEDLRSKLNQAIIDLGMGTGDANIDNNLVRYVTEKDAQESGNLAVTGTFVFQGGIVGDNSKISIIGDQNVLNALSVAQIQSGKNSELDVKITNAHNGQIIGRDVVADNVVRGIITGIDVKLSNPALIKSYNSTTGKIIFTAPAEALEMYLHVVNNSTSAQVGANEGQTFDISISQMDTAALEIDNAFVTTMEESQKAITVFDQALARIVSARATIGAQINRLEYTMQNLSTTRQNLVESESRIRDLDVAEESATFARNQVLVNSAVAMLAQANQLPTMALQLIRGQ